MTAMKPHEFYECLAKTGEYGIRDGGGIRRCSDGSCPILAVYKDFFDANAPMENEDALDVGMRMGLPTGFICDVIGGADNNIDRWGDCEGARIKIIETVNIAE